MAEEHERQARERSADSPYGIGATYVRATGSADLDGWEGVVALSDGVDSCYIEVAVYSEPGVDALIAVDASKIERAVEERAAGFTFSELCGQGKLLLSPGDILPT